MSPFLKADVDAPHNRRKPDDPDPRGEGVGVRVCPSKAIMAGFRTLQSTKI